MAILVNLFFLLIGFVIIKKAQKRYISYLNHFNIFAFIWAFITVGSQLFYKDLISIENVIIFYISWLFYLAGSLILKHKNFSTSSYNKENFRRIKFLILILFIFGIIANWEVLNLIGNVGNLTAWAALRKDNSFDELEDSIFITLFQRGYLIYVPLAIFLYKNKKLSNLLLIIIFTSGLIYSVLRFTRAPILQYFIVLLISYVFIYKRRIPVFFIFLSVAFIFIAFGGSMYFLMEGTKSHSIFDDIKLYLFGGQVSYQDFLNGNYIDNTQYDSPYFSFDFINYILQRFSVIKTYPSYVREYTPNPNLTTNTYTFLDAFTYDFGVVGAIIGSFFLGFFSDYVYHLYVKRKNIFILIFYGNICYFSCFVFANNEFIRFSVLLVAGLLYLYNLIIFTNLKNAK